MEPKPTNGMENNHKTAHVNPGDFDGFRVHKTNFAESRRILGWDWSKIHNKIPSKKGVRDFFIFQTFSNVLLAASGYSTDVLGRALTGTSNASRNVLATLSKSKWVEKNILKKRKSRDIAENAFMGLAALSNTFQMAAAFQGGTEWEALAATAVVAAYLILTAVPAIQRKAKLKARKITHKVFQEQRQLTEKYEKVKNGTSCPVGYYVDAQATQLKIDMLNKQSRKHEKKITQTYQAERVAGGLILARALLQTISGVSQMVTSPVLGIWHVADTISGLLFTAGATKLALNKDKEFEDRQKRFHERMAYQTAEITMPAGHTDCLALKSGRCPHLEIQNIPKVKPP